MAAWLTGDRHVNHRSGERAKRITAWWSRGARPDSKPGRKKRTWHPRYGVRELAFTDCEVPVSNRIGNEGEGYNYSRSRRSMADASASPRRRQASRKARSSRRWPMRKQRQGLRPPIADFQAIQFMLADMATEIDAARLLVRKGGVENRTRGGRLHVEASIAKAVCFGKWPRASRTKRCRFTAATSYSRDIRVERMYRDARITEITRARAKSSGW